MCVSKEDGKYIWIDQNREFEFLGSFGFDHAYCLFNTVYNSPYE